MEKQKITLHRALSELKLIDSKIGKQISEILPCSIVQKDKLINGHLNKEDFSKSALSKYDSVNDLIKRKAAIKSAIVEANSKTLVKIAGKEMTIADAITLKSIMAFKVMLADKLKAKHREALSNLNQSNDIVNQNMQRILEATFGKENVRVGKEDVESVRKPYMEANEFHLVDPLNILQKIEYLEKEISEFEADVDATLSEANAITFIEV